MSEAVVEATSGSGEEELTVYSTPWCGYCVRLKKLLENSGIAYREVDIEQDPAAAEIVMNANGGNQTVPTVKLPNGRIMTNPSLAEVKAGLASVSS